MALKIGVCGIACEACPKMMRGECPAGESGCTPRPNPFCAITRCAKTKGVQLCFECPDFPCETSKEGPIAYGFCSYIAGKAV